MSAARCAHRSSSSRPLIKATLPGSQTSQQDSGIGDPQVGGTLFFINQPDKREYSGLLTLITLPVGSYDAQHPDVSAGANRWVPLSLQLHPWRRQNWVLEASLEAQFYGNNDNYLGSSLKQQPLYRLQAFASYDTHRHLWRTAAVPHRGGALRLNGQDLPDTRQNSTQLGGTGPLGQQARPAAADAGAQCPHQQQL
jgi:hypothetical protein